MKDETPSFDPADYLKTPASLAIFLKAAAAENDPAYLALARDAARRAKRRWRIDAERPSNP